MFLQVPALHKMIACAPLIEKIDIEPYLNDSIELVSVCGENGKQARTCHYSWVLSIKDQCERNRVPFHFSKTGTYLLKDGKRFFIPFSKQSEQARKAGIDYLTKGEK